MQKSEINKIKERLVEIVKNKEATCVTINGKWGTGKTYFWQKFAEENSEKLNKKFVYVSLFGKESIGQITQEIILKAKTNKGLLEIFKKATNLRFDEILNGFVPTLGSAIMGCVSFRDIVICFDDFERLSDKLNLKDAFGLISELKEQKNCHIVMIFNADEVKFDDEVKKYKDKIIDYEFEYNPSIEDSYEIVKDRLKCFKEYPLEYFKDKNIKNIRVMRRVVNALNDFGFLEKELDGFDVTREILAKHIMEIATINSLFARMDFSELIGYYLDSSSKNGNEQENKIFKEATQYIACSIFEHGYIREDITNCITKSIIDEDRIKDIVKFMKLKEDTLNELSSYDSILRYDFLANNEAVCDKIKEIFDINIDMINACGVQNFIYYINLIKEFNPKKEKEYHTFAVSKLQEFFNTKYIDLYFDEMDDILNFDDNLKMSCERILNQNEKSKISTKEAILDILIKKENLNNLKLIEKVDDETLKNYILTDMKFCQGVFRFLNNRFSQSSEFKNLVDKFIKIFENINDERKEPRSEKILKILKEFHRPIVNLEAESL
ncbi:hypothetical protein CMCT_1483 [Campylobacter mucosalis]|uniref:P-loop NTPase fold protein n=1 Tax=Campylobacter mucosalis TaxID=202 RepID=UPI00068C496B|nr:P-loop NTPase fold protein [Campylobacter mucosalis]QKF63598.1 hypothetical protein CMCT_1483 [Campylobacter mucosalis]